MPQLQDGDFELWASNVIVPCRCKRGSPPRDPTEPHTPFDAERWMERQQTRLNPASGAAFVQWVRHRLRGAPLVGPASTSAPAWLGCTLNAGAPAGWPLRPVEVCWTCLCPKEMKP